MKKFIFEFEQQKAVNMGLNLKQLLLLSYLNTHIDSGTKVSKIVNYNDYYKFTYQTILNDLPIAFKTRWDVLRCLKNLEEKRLVYIHNDKQKRLFIALNYKLLF